LPVVTALEMRDAVAAECRDADVLIMAAAVADWRPEREAAQKLKKGASRSWSIELTRSPDILAEVQGEHLVKVGFAAETEEVESNARAKVKHKGLHLIAANDVTAEGSGFGADTNKVILLDREGGVEELGLMSKYEVGHQIFDRVAGMLQ
jgi:phosphopantothenoylcysteine decarboxylase/phosphopantothenate--cysteine ligase